MSIDRNLLFRMVKDELIRNYSSISFDLPTIIYLIEKVIFNDPTKGCEIRGKKMDWQGLPTSKSLFYAGKNKGLPIGNLTSQLFGNVYLNGFDHFVKRDLKIHYYGRYVDDFVIVHPDKDYLKSITNIIREYLKSQLKLDLHPNKIYLQHYSKGVKFLGTVIKPNRIYIANRTKGNFAHSIDAWNKIIREKHRLSMDEQDAFLSSINSYLGIMRHYKTYRMRKKMLREHMSAYFWNAFFIGNNYLKLEKKRKIVKQGHKPL